ESLNVRRDVVGGIERLRRGTIRERNSHRIRNARWISQRERNASQIPIRRTSRVCRIVFETGQPPGVGIDPRKTVTWQQIRDLISAADSGLVFSGKAGRPGKADRGREIVFVAWPDSQVRIFRIRADQNDLRRSCFDLTAIMESFVE